MLGFSIVTSMSQPTLHEIHKTLKLQLLSDVVILNVTSNHKIDLCLENRHVSMNGCRNVIAIVTIYYESVQSIM